MNDGPIDRIRNSALTMTLPKDTGGVSEMCEINGGLHILGGQAIYRVQLADEIDPKRTNIAIPNTHQRVLSYGTDFPYVRQTLMTARRLFKDGVLGNNFDYKGAISLSFEALQDLVAMHDINKDLQTRLDKISEDLKSLAVKQRSLTVPSIGDVRGETKAFLQKADHVAIALFNIAKLFYGDEIGRSWFESLYKLASTKYGVDDPFTKFLKAVLPLLQFVRNARNGVEHPKKDQYVKVVDISLRPSAELSPPCIEIMHPETPLPSIPLLTLTKSIADELASVFEIMIAHLCGANVQSCAGIPLGVIEYDDNYQKAFKCRFGYGARMGDQMVPFG